MDDYILYIIYAMAYGASILAFSFNSIYWLRGLTIFSSILFAIYYFFFPAEPLWIDIVAEISMVLVNLFMIFLILSRQRNMNFSAEENEVYEAFFSKLSPFQFYKLIRICKWQSLKAGRRLISKGEELDKFYFIYNGVLTITRGENIIKDLSDGYFVGERSFGTKEVANADVTTKVATRLISWNQEEVRDLLKRNPAMRDQFNAILIQDLSKKLYD